MQQQQLELVTAHGVKCWLSLDVPAFPLTVDATFEVGTVGYGTPSQVNVVYLISCMVCMHDDSFMDS